MPRADRAGRPIPRVVRPYLFDAIAAVRPAVRVFIGGWTAVAVLLVVSAPECRSDPGAQAPTDSSATATADSSRVPPADATAGSREDLPGAAQSLEGRPIRSIRLIVRNVFDPLPDGPLRFVGRLANRAHIRTRAGTVRDQMILRPGDAWSAERGEEATRHLRTLSFLNPEQIRPVAVGDSVDLVVETRDVWTTQPEFQIEKGGGKIVGSLAFTEKNLLGYGKSVSISYREDPVGITRSLGFYDPGVGGSRLQLQFGGTRGTSGSSDGVQAGVPFYSTSARWSFGVLAGHRSGESHLFQNNAEVAVVAEHAEETEAFLGRGWKHGGNVTRATVSLNSVDRRLGPTQIVAGSRPPAAFVGPEALLKLRRASVEVRLWHPNYITRTGVARVDRVEDFDLGPSASIKLGVSPRIFGSTADFGEFRVRLDAGTQTRFGFGMLRSSVSGRWRRTPEEVLEVVSGRWIWQSSSVRTLEGAVWGIAGIRGARNFQAVVGGLNGLRAYPVHAVAGTRLLRWNLEERQLLVRDVFQIVSIGSAVFLDGARGWGSGAEGAGAFHCAGIGVRLAPPRAAIGPVIRADLAWPISPTRDGRREPVLSLGSSQAF